MTVDLDKVAKSEGIKYFLISFVDLFGVLRSKLVPARAIGQMQEDGAGFAGFAAWLDMTPADPDMFAIPDPASLIQLPWKPEVAWLAGDLWMAGKPVEASRLILRTPRRPPAQPRARGPAFRHPCDGRGDGRAPCRIVPRVAFTIITAQIIQ